jgi:histone H3/H4
LTFENQERKNALVNRSIAILAQESIDYNVQILQEAKETLERKVVEFMDQPITRIFEKRESTATRDFDNGILTISKKACEIAVSANRSAVTSSDVEEAIRMNFCHVWPFCR